MRRRFLDFPHGQLHVREHAHQHAGTGGSGGVPLLMLHAAPGSALMLTPLQLRLAVPTIAIDLPGMGDSDALRALPSRELEIADYADAVASAVDDVAVMDVYGTLSGVRVALELAHRLTSRVRRVVLDGIGIPKPEQLPELLADYAPEFAPDINGTQFQSTFLLCRDQYLFYPWYARDAEHRRPNGLPDAAVLHTKTMESLKSASGFRPLIRAAFRYDVASKLKTLTQPALISADGSTLRSDCELLAEPPQEPLTATDDNLQKRAAQINAFLAAS
jgi:pimeloyl-ACP methyl ester carboxylesterase